MAIAALMGSLNTKRVEAEAIDGVNRKFGSNTMFFAAADIKREWQIMRNENPALRDRLEIITNCALIC